MQFRNLSSYAAPNGETTLDGLPREVTLLALGKIPGIGHNAVVKLYESAHFDDVLRASRDQLATIMAAAEISKLNGDGRDDFIEAFLSQRDAALEQAWDDLRRYSTADISIVLDSDPRYPPLLRTIHERPRWLFVRGSAEVLSSPKMVAIVGTRDPTPAAKRLTALLTEILARHDYCILSGLAEGVDAVAHRVTLDAGKPTVAVLATGIFNDFPAATAALREPIVRTGGALVTEFFPKEQRSPERFEQRDRLQAGLSPLLIPVEAQIPSGTWRQVRWAKSYGRRILGVIGRDQPESQLHRVLRYEGFPVVEVDESGERLVEALATYQGLRDIRAS